MTWLLIGGHAMEVDCVALARLIESAVVDLELAPEDTIEDLLEALREEAGESEEDEDDEEDGEEAGDGDDDEED